MVAVTLILTASLVVPTMSVWPNYPATSPPPPPSLSQLRGLVSEATGVGATGYDQLDVRLVRFVSGSEWLTIGTRCLTA